MRIAQGTGPTSYAQRHEDLHLLRCFEGQPTGIYIDIGAGHPVFDNVSFAFYLRGWSGVTVEPNPWLSQLANAVRPRDTIVEALVSREAGEADFYLVDEYHGLSTMNAAHAERANAQFAKASRTMRRPVATLRDLCERLPGPAFDFLKIDVEGAEADVIAGGDFRRFRPRVIVVEALAPYTLDPAWDAYEPVLFAHGYRYVLFDSLNRYYVAEEEVRILDLFDSPPPSFEQAIQFRNFGPALQDADHPDHRLAGLLASADPVRLPLLPREALASLLAADLDDSDRRAEQAYLDRAVERLFADSPPVPLAATLLRSGMSLRGLYLKIAESDAIRVACGRISASSAW
ncbi:MAG: FkbM family methyltransferase [Pseudorhodoplanes sp.]|nr:FkbM family methyltransferase [Pseudorhodoplanes sp.]